MLEGKSKVKMARAISIRVRKPYPHRPHRASRRRRTVSSLLWPTKHTSLWLLVCELSMHRPCWWRIRLSYRKRCQDRETWTANSETRCVSWPTYASVFTDAPCRLREGLWAPWWRRREHIGSIHPASLTARKCSSWTSRWIQRACSAPLWPPCNASVRKRNGRVRCCRPACPGRRSLPPLRLPGHSLHRW